MKPPPVRYVRPGSEEELLALLAEYGNEAKILAGGQSLIPQLAMRLVEPAVLIDINGLPDAAGISAYDGQLRIGPLVRHRDIERSAVIAERAPLLRLAVGHLGNRAVRNRGTFCGSLAFADPGAEFPACAVALGAELCLRSLRGERAVRAGDFFCEAYQTVIEPDEYLAGAFLPAIVPGEMAFFDEESRRPTGYALAGLAARVCRKADRIVSASLAFFGIGDRPLAAVRTASLLASASLRRLPADDVVAVLRDELEGDVSDFPDAAYRLHLMDTLCQRFVTHVQALEKMPHAA